MPLKVNLVGRRCASAPAAGGEGPAVGPAGGQLPTTGAGHWSAGAGATLVVAAAFLRRRHRLA
jgi:LPXTG-motif cell wall-anchored protein